MAYPGEGPLENERDVLASFSESLSEHKRTHFPILLDKLESFNVNGLHVCLVSQLLGAGCSCWFKIPWSLVPLAANIVSSTGHHASYEKRRGNLC